MLNLIIPAAKTLPTNSDARPSWLHVHPNGNLLLAESIKGLDLIDVRYIYVGLQKKHLDRFQCREGLVKQFKQLGLAQKLRIVELRQPTRSQPETVAKMIKQAKISGPIFVKDVDNYFSFQISNENAVTVQELNDVESINAESKSYVSVDDNFVINNIVEKKVISNLFCSGGYSFTDAQMFVKYFQKLKTKPKLFTSHLIFQMLIDGIVFKALKSSNFIDWGTPTQWQLFRSGFSTLFIDLDGVLLFNSGEYAGKRWGATTGILPNINVINQLFDSGKVQVIITTARKEEYRNQTLAQLKREGVKYHQILFGMMHAKRIVINDYSATNPYKCCDAINVKRDSTDLVEMIDESIR